MKTEYIMSTRLFEINADIPKKCGYYCFWDENDQIVYIGSSNNVRKRIGESLKKRYPQKKISYVSFGVTVNTEEARKMERFLIYKYKPLLNEVCAIFYQNSFKFIGKNDYAIDLKKLQKHLVIIKTSSDLLQEIVKTTRLINIE